MAKFIRVSHIVMPPKHTIEEVKEKAVKKLRLSMDQISDIKIAKQSIDARKKHDIHYEYSVDLYVKFSLLKGAEDKNAYKRYPWMKDKNISIMSKDPYRLPEQGQLALKHPPIIVGSGPAGLFCCYALTLAGFHPIMIERGKAVEDRIKDVESFWNTGKLNTNSNVQFGEGGAGTFSDGKLNTMVKDKSGRNHFVLETFVKFGANPDILYVNKPHIGTDILVTVLEKMRAFLLQSGAEIHFETQMTDIKLEKEQLTGIICNDQEELDTDVLVLAPGHSARDTFEQLHKRVVPMEAKAFAIGFRVEHPQDMIQLNQYKTNDRIHFPAAAYKVTSQTSNGRGVYSFCMCPGGHVVNASSEEGRIAVNGMSYRDRDSVNANSAMIITIKPDDFPSKDVLGGMEFQREIEEKAYEIGNGNVPQQLFEDFENNVPSQGPGSFSSCLKGLGAWANLRSILPEFLNDAFIEGMHLCGNKIEGFDRPDAILSAIESRTSSPVRILRNEEYESNIKGLYPCGEGAGYAGGIMSAAMDGLKVAEAIIAKYRPLDLDLN